LERFFFFLKLNKEYTLILKFAVITLVLIHIAGCLWYFVGSMSPGDNWITKFELENEEVVT
jgi:hypothetical protein